MTGSIQPIDLPDFKTLKKTVKATDAILDRIAPANKQQVAIEEARLLSTCREIQEQDPESKIMDIFK